MDAAAVLRRIEAERVEKQGSGLLTDDSRHIPVRTHSNDTNAMGSILSVAPLDAEGQQQQQQQQDQRAGPCTVKQVHKQKEADAQSDASAWASRRRVSRLAPNPSPESSCCRSLGQDPGSHSLPLPPPMHPITQSNRTDPMPAGGWQRRGERSIGIGSKRRWWRNERAPALSRRGGSFAAAGGRHKSVSGSRAGCSDMTVPIHNPLEGGGNKQTNKRTHARCS